MTGGEIVVGLAGAAKGAAGVARALGGDRDERLELADAAKGSRAIEVAAQARADRVAIRQMVLTKLFAPLANWVGYKSEYFAKEFAENLAEKLVDVPEEELVSPTPSVAYQAMEGLSFSLNEPDLKEMYLNLLATSSDRRVADDAHPSFAQVIKQLSSAEASLLLDVLAVKPGVEMVRLALQKNDASGFQRYANHILHMVDRTTDEAVVHKNLSIQIDNWERLGLTRSNYAEWRVGPTAYDWVGSRPEYLAAVQAAAEDRSVKWDKGLLIPTDFGRRFLEAVQPPASEPPASDTGTAGGTEGDG